MINWLVPEVPPTVSEMLGLFFFRDLLLICLKKRAYLRQLWETLRTLINCSCNKVNFYLVLLLNPPVCLRRVWKWSVDLYKSRCDGWTTASSVLQWIQLNCDLFKIIIQIESGIWTIMTQLLATSDQTISIFQSVSPISSLINGLSPVHFECRYGYS